MAKLYRPELFSIHFSLDADVLDNAGFIDPILNSDTKLFVDPLLLSSSANETIRGSGAEMLTTRFSDIIRLVAASQATGDAAWRAAFSRLDLSEAPMTCLGYGGASISGSSRPDTLKQRILLTAKDIITLGENDPYIISLMGLFEDGVGPDTISDMTTNFIAPVLAALTSEFCTTNGIPTREFLKFPNTPLPENPYRKDEPILLVPKDIIRHLPLAADWNEVYSVALEVRSIRDAVNSFLASITKATLSEKKDALRRAALQSLANFRELFEALLNSSNHYDPNEDIMGFYAFRSILRQDYRAADAGFVPPTIHSKEELQRTVVAIVDYFKRLIETNNLWEMLWANSKPRKERAAQLLLFAVADAFCAANNIDISPEMNSGGGPVDFKFSTGYHNRILVEVKMSTGRVVHGYKQQLEIYKAASDTDAGIFVICDVGGLNKKMDDILEMQRFQRASGKRASEIILIDATPKESASKRK